MVTPIVIMIHIGETTGIDGTDIIAGIRGTIHFGE
tara:strand:- start:295653 stop:295757 length:105 start_codon:yes stop_codon:yes gene_type:complete